MSLRNGNAIIMQGGEMQIESNKNQIIWFILKSFFIYFRRWDSISMYLSYQNDLMYKEILQSFFSNIIINRYGSNIYICYQTAWAKR